MGFKKVSKKELRNKYSKSFIGAPIKDVEDILDLEKEFETLEAKKEKKLVKSSKVKIRAEEQVEYMYSKNGELEKTSGSGKINVINESQKDRLWDIKLQLQNLYNTNLNEGKILSLGNIDPEKAKSMDYRLKSSNRSFQPLKITENIDLLEINTANLDEISEKFKNEEKIESEFQEQFFKKEEESISSEKKKRTSLFTKSVEMEEKEKFLLFKQKNSIKFSISLENSEEYTLKDLKFAKFFGPQFSNFKYETDMIRELNIEMDEDTVYCYIDELEPDKTIRFTIYVDIIPNERNLIGTGDIQISYILEKDLLSKLEVDDFSAYSHAMHAISKKEKEEEPNVWKCSVIFKNNSDYEMLLKSISILDQNRNKTFLNEQFGRDNSILPGKVYNSKEWEVENKSEPKFLRKLEYSTAHKFEKVTLSTIKIKQDFFDLIDAEPVKKFSEYEIKSFEEKRLNSTINIKNKGTEDITAILIKELIPKDFTVPIDKSKYYLRTSEGKVDNENFNIKLDPQDEDHTKPHNLEIFIYQKDTNNQNLIKTEDFIEIRYPLQAKSPDYRTNYQFPLNISTFYPMFSVQEAEEKLAYVAEEDLKSDQLPNLDIVHKRRDLLIGKEIFPGKTVDEFGINVVVKNNSNIEVKNIEIKDTLSKSFEFISSNVKQKITESKDSDEYTIAFEVDKILPYQEKEIRYYVKKTGKNKTGGFKELESYILG